MATEGLDPGSIWAIVLAGGGGARFGGGKLTHPWRGGVLLDGALAAAFAAPARTVLVVTGADPAVARAARAFARALGQSRRLHLVHAVDHAEGMAASLRSGIMSLPRRCAAAFVFLGDMPHLSTTIAPRLLHAVAAGAPAAAPVFAGVRGHPVLFARALFPALVALTGDAGARALLDALSGLALVETDDPGVLRDVDTPADLAASHPSSGRR